jgi:hypothetical protein
MDEQNKLNFLVDIPHQFEVDLNMLVVANHRFTIDGISRAIDEETDQLKECMAEEESEVLSSAISHMTWQYERLRWAANRLALVGAVTCLDEWIAMLVTKENLNQVDVEKADSKLITQMRRLNKSLNIALPLQDFEDLVLARDSIIHGNSKAKWIDHRREWRTVPSRYMDAWGGIAFTEEDLERAIDKMIQQVLRYDERITLNRIA